MPRQQVFLSTYVMPAPGAKIHATIVVAMPVTQHAGRTYEEMKRNLLAHLQQMFPIQGKIHRLELAAVEVQDNLDPGDYRAQKSARMEGRSWAVPVVARFELKDMSGKVVDRARMKIVDLPRLTNRGSYIVGGSEYMFPTQKRLRSGPYVRSGENHELRTFFNMAKGRNFHLGMHPEKGHFQFQVDSSKNIPLFPLLKALGVGDDDMVRAWGREVFVQNRKNDPATETKALKTIFDKMSYGAKMPPPEELPRAIAELFNNSRMDPANTELTIGKPIDRASGEALLLASAKMLKVGRGEVKEDNRDSLIHNDIVDLADFVVERFKDYQFRNRIERAIRFNIDRRNKISQIISRDAFQRPVDSLFTESQLSQSPIQTNPLGMISDYTAVTVRGEGGIQQDNALTRGLRALDPSHLGFLDPAHTPEGSGVGTTLHLTTAARKQGRDLVTRALDVNTGKEVELTPVQLWKSTIAFPEAVDPKTNKIRRGLSRVKASRGGEVSIVPVKQVQYAFIVPEHLMDVNTASIPFTSHNNGARVMLASKLGVQAKPLVGAEKPLVQSAVPGDKGTVERAVGEAFSPRSPVDGVVEKVTDEEVVVSGHRVSIPNYFPLNSNNFMHGKPTVKVGDKVKKGQVLADTNYTKDGELTLGKNLRVAYIPYKGMNVEDGVVISQSAADKMSSEHLYQQPYSFDADTVLDLKRFRAYFPAKITDTQARNLDERGVVKKGAKVEPGDILVLSMRKQAQGTESQRLARISRILAREYRDDSLTWTKDVSGVVQDVAWRPNEVVIHIRTQEPMRVGDKIVGRYANKGIVVHIVPDDQMPQDEKGRPIDLLMNPNGVISRMNLGQILETTASRIAEKTGKPFIAKGFGEDSAKRIRDELERHGLKDHETIYDPSENYKIPGVLVGQQYIYKLEHQATKKISARGGGADEAYTDDEQPVRGKEGGRAIGNMELYALLAHGALANVHEMYGIKSSFDPEVWRAIESGAPLPPPKPAFAQQKFMTMLKGMGIDVQVNKDSMAVVPFLDRHVKKISAGEITDHKLVRGKDLKEEKGGLFDTKKTGGIRGDKWTHIRLPEPLPNPTFEKAILSLLHMKKADFDEIMAGKRKVGALTGGQAIKFMLSRIDVDKRLREAQEQVKGKSGSELNALHKEIRFLKALKENGIKPQEYVIEHMPVLPPRFRPIYTLPDGNLNVSDVNFHYQALLQLGEQYRSMGGKEFGEQRQKLVPELYKAVGGVMGLNDGVVERAKAPKGIAQIIGGTGSPKGGYLHSRVLKRRQDVSATNVIVANPKLGIDEIGLPEATAWKTFRPFLIRELKTMGMTPLQAKKAIDDKTPQAKKALEKVVSERHVILNRAPTLHKFSVMAFKPRLVPGYALEIPPLIVGGFNADFDGDRQLNSVFTFTSESARIASELPREWWDLRKVGDEDMAARFGVSVPTVIGGEFHVINLADFPRRPEHRKVQGGRVDFHPVPDDIFVLSQDELGSVVLAQVNAWSRHRDCETVVITLKNGKQILADDDPRAVYGIDPETMSFGRWRPSESVGKLVPVASRPTIALSESGRDKLTVNARATASGNVVVSELDLDHDSGYFIGAIVGDGWVSGRLDNSRQINMCCSDDGVRTRWSAAARMFFVDDVHVSDQAFERADITGEMKASRRLVISSVSLAEVMSDWVGRGSKNKHLPPFFVSSCQDFRLGLLAGLMDTDGNVSWNDARKKPQPHIQYTTTSSRLAIEVKFLCLSLGIRSSITTTSTPAGGKFYVVNMRPSDVYAKDIRLSHAVKSRNLNRLNEDQVPSEASGNGTELVPLGGDLAAAAMAVCRGAGYNVGYVQASKAKSCGYVSREVARKICDLADGDERFAFLGFLSGNKDVSWSPVTGFEETGIVEEGYDLTVPGRETFMAVDGVILSNTMGIHVPVTAEANAEAEKMLPSKHLYKPGSKKLQPKIEHEYVLGLFKISNPGRAVRAKRFNSTGEVISELNARRIEPNALISVMGIGATTPGRILINEVLPKKLRDYGQIWTDKSIQSKLVEVDKVAGRDAFVKTLQAWADIGRRYAYLTGSSFLLSDLQAMGPQRNAAYRRADAMAERIRMGPGSIEDKKQKIVELYMNVSGRLGSKMSLKPNATGASNNIRDMMVAGARGNPGQVRQMVSNIGVMLDHENRPMPEPVRGTYTEGLDSAEFFQHMYGNRKGMIDRSQSVRDPGALTKQVIVSAAGLRISQADCMTTNGIMEMTTGDAALDRYLVENTPGVGQRGTLVTPAILAAARSKRMDRIKVRSPLTCRAPVGVCAKCYGLDEEGKLPPIGEHVGIKDAQGLTEPSTQLAMKAFHTGGIATTGKSLTTGFDRVKQLFTMPDNVHDKATLAEIGGRVDAVRALPQGGQEVTINGKKHRVARGRKLTIKIGDQVERGQQITDGDAQPQDVLRLRGLRQLQTHLRDEVQKVYAAGGERIHAKTIETPVRMLTETVRVTDPGDHSSLVTGDYSTYAKVDAWNRENVGKKPVRYVHQLPGSEYLPHRSDDWAKRMAHNRIQQVLTEAPAMGSMSQLQGESPFAALITGQRIKRDPWSQGGLTSG